MFLLRASGGLRDKRRSRLIGEQALPAVLDRLACFEAPAYSPGGGPPLSRLAEALEIDPSGTYRVTVQIEDEAPANTTSLPELAKLLSRRAQSRGLTPERLTDLLDDDA